MENVCNTTFDAGDVVLEGTHTSDVSSLAGPGRDASEAREHKKNGLSGVGGSGTISEKTLNSGTGVFEVDIITVDEEAVEHISLWAAGVGEDSFSLFRDGVDEVDVKSVDGSKLAAKLCVGPLQKLSALGGMKERRTDQGQHLEGWLD